MNFNIIVTSKCNLQCSYCYEENKTYYDMDEETATKTVDFIEYMLKNKNTDFHSNKVIFHGGEPLINFNIIKFIKNRLDVNLDKKYKISYMMTTNGTILNNEIVDFLINNNISLSVSIDGTKTAHNKNRIYSNGQGSYNTVIRNVKTLEKVGLLARCRMTYNSANVHELYEGLVELADLGLKLFIPVADFYDKEWDYSSIKILESEIDKIISDEKLRNVTISLVDSKNISTKQNDCFGGMTSFTISESGKIYPCVFVLNEKKFIIGDIFNDNQLYINKKYMEELLNEQFLEEDNCNGCKAKEYCIGTRCKLLNYMITGKYNNPPAINCSLTHVRLNTYKKLELGCDCNV